MKLTGEVPDPVDHARVFSLLSVLIPLDPEPNVISSLGVVNKLAHIANGTVLRPQEHSLAQKVS